MFWCCTTSQWMLKWVKLSGGFSTEGFRGMQSPRFLWPGASVNESLDQSWSSHFHVWPNGACWWWRASIFTHKVLSVGLLKSPYDMPSASGANDPRGSGGLWLNLEVTWAVFHWPQRSTWYSRNWACGRKQTSWGLLRRWPSLDLVHRLDAKTYLIYMCICLHLHV